MPSGVKTAMSDQESKRNDDKRDDKAEVVPATSDRPSEHGARDRDRGRRRHRSNQPRHLEASINMNELRELVDLITENGLTSFELEREGFRVKVGRGTVIEDQNAPAQLAPAGTGGQLPAGAVTQPSSSVQSIPTSPSHPGAQAEEAASVDQDLHIITSPIVGTFYRSPSPTSDNFVRIGSQVEFSTVVCIIEAMKLMNEIQAETSGEVVKIYVENAQAVEYGQPLFGIKSQ